MATKRRLGRGLDSLIPALTGEPEPRGVEEIPLSSIELNPKQPRTEIDTEELEGLAESIKSSGVIQPVVVRPGGAGSAGYELVVGERRARAARMAGLETVPALVRDVADEEMLGLALVENIQRADLNPIEKARAVRRMISELDLTQEEAGRRLGLERSTIANLLRLLELSEELQGMVLQGKISAGHARALLAVGDEEVRASLARKIASEGLSVREAERLAARSGGSGSAAPVRTPSPNVVRIEEALSTALGARVEVKQKRKGGKIVIHFLNHDDFERLYESLTGQDASDYPHRIPA